MCLLWGSKPTTFFSLLIELMLVKVYLKSGLSNTSPGYSVLNQRNNPDFILNDTGMPQYLINM